MSHGKWLTKLALLVLVVVLAFAALTACDKAAEYTVKFFDEDGKTLIGEAQTVKEGEELTVPSAPAKDGYTFVGWLNGDEVYDFAGDGAKKVTKDLTFVAKYEKATPTYTVRFVTDDGTSVGADQVLEAGKKFVVPEDPTKTGYEFLGWVKDGENDLYDMTAANARVVKGDVTFRASFRQVTYTVKFMDGTAEIGETQHLHYGDTLTVPDAPAKTGYTFDGWYVGTDKIDFTADGAKTVTGDITYTAKYVINGYSLKFWLDDGTTEFITLTVNYGAAVAFPDPAPTKAGHVFRGWLLKGADGYGTELYDKTGKTVSGDMEFKAVFGEEISLTFKVGDTEEIIRVAKGDAYRLPASNPAAEIGKVFKGWALEGTTTVFDFTGKTVETAQTFVPVFDWIRSTVTVKIPGKADQTLTAVYGTGLDGTITQPAKRWLYTMTLNGHAIDSLDDVDFAALTGNVTIAYEYIIQSGGNVSIDESGITIDTGATLPLVSVDPKQGFDGTFTVDFNDNGSIFGLALLITDGTNKKQVFFFSWAMWVMIGHDQNTKWEVNPNGYSVPDGRSVRFAYADGTLYLTDGTWSLSIPMREATNGQAVLDENQTWSVGFETWWATGGPHLVTDFAIDNECSAADIACLQGNHTWNDGVANPAATCTEDGNKLFTCTHCGATKNEKIDALGHIDENNDGVCDRDGCGASLIEIIFKDPDGKVLGKMSGKNGDTVLFPTDWLTDNTKQINGWKLEGSDDVVTEATVGGNATYVAVLGAKVVRVTVTVAGETKQTLTATYGTGLSADIVPPAKKWMYNLVCNGQAIASLDDVDFAALTEDVTIQYTYLNHDDFSGGGTTFGEDGMTLTTATTVFVDTVDQSKGFRGSFTASVNGGYGFAFFVGDGTHKRQVFLFGWGIWLTTDHGNQLEVIPEGYPNWTATGTAEITIHYAYANGVLTLTDGNFVYSTTLTATYTGASDEAPALETGKDWLIGFETWYNNGGVYTIREFSLEKSCSAEDLACLQGNHTWNEGTVETEATCTEDGSKLFTCSHCGEEKHEKIDALGHIDEDHDGTCDREGCGATVEATDETTD